MKLDPKKSPLLIPSNTFLHKLHDRGLERMDNQHRLKFLAWLILVCVRAQNFALPHSTNILYQGPIGNVLDFWKIELSDPHFVFHLHRHGYSTGKIKIIVHWLLNLNQSVNTEVPVVLENWHSYLILDLWKIQPCFIKEVKENFPLESFLTIFFPCILVFLVI